MPHALHLQSVPPFPRPASFPSPAVCSIFRACLAPTLPHPHPVLLPSPPSLLLLPPQVPAHATHSRDPFLPFSRIFVREGRREGFIRVRRFPALLQRPLPSPFTLH